MNIEPGKFYRLRNGLKAEIYSVGNPGLYSVHGRIFDDGEVTSDAWQSPGNYRVGGIESQFDIIAEWTEPVPKLVLWRCKKTHSDIGKTFYEGEMRLFAEDDSDIREEWERVDLKRIEGFE